MPYSVEDILAKINDEDALWLFSEPFIQEDISVLIQALKSPECSKITHITLDTAELDDVTIIALFKALSTAAGQFPNFPKLKMISLSDNQISSAGVIAIVKILQEKYLCLYELDLSSNQIDELGAAALAGAPLSVLNLASNPLNAKAYATLAKTQTLQELDLRSTIQDDTLTTFNANDVASLIPLDSIEPKKLIGTEADKGVIHFPQNTSLVSLRLSSNHLTAIGFRALAGWLSPQLRALDLNNNKGGDAVAAFKMHPNLEALHIENNDVTPLAVADLSKNTRLRILYLGNNLIGGARTQHEKEVEVLEIIRALRELELGNRPVLSENVGVENLVAMEGLAQNTSLTLLDLSNCQIGAEGLTELCKSQNTNLFRLHLKGNKFGNAALPALTRFLTTHPNVAAIGLENNALTDQGVEDLLKLTSLTSLDLDKNKLTERSAQFFLDQNKTLTLFSLNGNQIPAAMNQKILTKRQTNTNDLLDRQTSFNVFLYKYHVAKEKHTQAKAVVSFVEPLELGIFLLLFPKEIVCHIFTLLPFSWLQKTPPQIAQQFKFFASKREQLSVELRSNGPKAASIVKPILLKYEQECRVKRKQSLPTLA